MTCKQFPGGELTAMISNTDQIVHGILSDMSLKEKAGVANLDEDKVPYGERGRKTWSFPIGMSKLKEGI